MRVCGFSLQSDQERGRSRLQREREITMLVSKVWCKPKVTSYYDERLLVYHKPLCRLRKTNLSPSLAYIGQVCYQTRPPQLLRYVVIGVLQAQAV